MEDIGAPTLAPMTPAPVSKDCTTINADTSYVKPEGKPVYLPERLFLNKTNKVLAESADSVILRLLAFPARTETELGGSRGCFESCGL
jgi:hypothetical protein